AGLNQATNSAQVATLGEIESRLAQLLTQIPENLLQLSRSTPRGFDEIKPKLGSDEGWVGITIGDSSTTVALVTRAGVRLNLVAEGRDRIAQRVAILRRGLDPRSLEHFDVAASHSLYELLFSGFGASFTALSHLVVSSDGALQTLPL